jgi:hypothetical protein
LLFSRAAAALLLLSVLFLLRRLIFISRLRFRGFLRFHLFSSLIIFARLIFTFPLPESAERHYFGFHFDYYYFADEYYASLPVRRQLFDIYAISGFRLFSSLIFRRRKSLPPLPRLPLCASPPSRRHFRHVAFSHDSQPSASQPRHEPIFNRPFRLGLHKDRVRPQGFSDVS